MSVQIANPPDRTTEGHFGVIWVCAIDPAIVKAIAAILNQWVKV